MKEALHAVRVRTQWPGILALGLAYAALSPGQTSSVTSGTTPGPVAPGTPSTSYPLKGYSSYSPFTGKVNVAVPILHIGGRGSAAFDMVVRIVDQWGVNKSPTSDPQYPYLSQPVLSQWALWEPGYGPGTLFGRESNETITPCPGGPVMPEYSLSRLTFTAPDGTETELRDVNTDGKPYALPNYCTSNLSGWDAGRGTIFASRDGSGMSFTSDSTIQDYPVTGASSSTVFTVSGFLRLRDGTTYRIDNSAVTWMRDRNGNMINFTYNAQHQVTQITDPTGRVTTIYYAQPNCDPSNASAVCDIIQHSTKNNSSSFIVVEWDSLGQHLRSGYTLETWSQLFPEATASPYFPGSNATFNWTVVSTITLDDGTTFQFQYNSYAELARVTLPTGGAIEYDWTGFGGSGTDGFFGDSTGPGAAAIDRVVSAKREYSDGQNLSSSTSYGYSYSSSGSANNQTTIETVTDASGNTQSQITHNYFGNPYDILLFTGIAYNNWQEGKELSTQWGAPVLKTETYTWQQAGPVAWCNSSAGGVYACSASNGGGLPENNPRMVAAGITLNDTNQVTQTSYSYDAYNNETDRCEYDYGSGAPGALLRHTNTSYLTSNGAGNYVAPSMNILNLPAEIKVFDGANKLLSDTQYRYDEYGNPATPLYNAPNIIGHDNTNFAGPGPRGNVTTISQYLNSSNTWLNTTKSYDIAGNIINVTDANGHTQSFSYTDSYNDQQARNTYAYPTTITNALNQAETIIYDWGLGKPSNIVDANGVLTIYTYDPPGRLWLVDSAASTSAKTRKNYSYATPQDLGAAGSTVTENDDQNIFNDGALQTEQIYDGFGRLVQSRTQESSSVNIASSEAYNALGLPLWTTYPYRSNGDPNAIPYTNYSYDLLGRVKFITYPDGSKATTAYLGNQVTQTDPAGKVKQLLYDALGRLSSVVEDPSSVEDPNGLNYTTTYCYDALNNLVRVTQGAQARIFTYDSLGRLTSANNPESGTTIYTYDNVGNLATRTDNRNVTITYTYDALNRMSQKTYPDGTQVTYAYDASGVPNSIGHLTSASNANATTQYTGFDPLGRVVASSQTTAGQTYNFAYTYNLAGALTSETYPSGRVITNAYDGANRVLSVQGMLGGQTTNYATSISYWPHGGLNSFTAGNNVVPVYTYNNRLQMNEWWATIGNDRNHFLSHVIPNWGGTNNNGDLLSVQEGYGSNVPWNALTWLTQNYSYDGVNRLSSVTDSGYSRNFCYDAYGNGWVTGNTVVVLSGNTPQELGSPCPSSNTPFNNNNQITGGSYDAAGNQTIVNATALIYDAESRQISATDPPSMGGGTETYAYDGNGQRVMKSGPGGTTVYAYDALGQLVAEYSTAANTSPCSTCYLTWDHLGTPRLITDQNGNVVTWHDYLPFGEEIPGGTAGRTSQFGVSDGIATKFTGKERDQETGLDYFGARYYGSALGRFTSPDAPFADQNTADPQSWNLYSYVRNNPLNRTDPNGRLTVIIPGTFWSPSNWNDNMKLFNEARQKFHDPDVRILNWSGSATAGARMDAVQLLDQMVANHTFAPGEQLNIIGHSRGGDVAIDASNSISHKIDNLITLDSPGYYLTDGNMANIGTWINVSVDQDWVISLFSDDASKSRNEPGANNLHLSAPQYGHIAAHTAVWQDDQLRNLWWRYWQDHATCQESWDDKTNTLHGCQ